MLLLLKIAFAPKIFRNNMQILGIKLVEKMSSVPPVSACLLF